MPAKNPLGYAVNHGLETLTDAAGNVVTSTLPAGGVIKRMMINKSKKRSVVMRGIKRARRAQQHGVVRDKKVYKMTEASMAADRAAGSFPTAPAFNLDNFQPITAGVGTGQSFGAGALNVMGSSLAGGVMGAMMSDRGERGKGFVGGAMVGAAGGGFGTAFSRYGASLSEGAFRNAGKMFGKSQTFQKHAGTMHKTLRGFHSSQGRNNMFRSGAMLSGGAFGLMFASNGRSHKRGFNRNRGNSISR